MSDKLLTTNEVAERLNCTPLSVRRWAKQGRIPAFKFGRDYQFKPEDIDVFIDSCRVGNPVPQPA